MFLGKFYFRFSKFCAAFIFPVSCAHFTFMKVMLHGMTFNDDFEGNITCGQFLMQQIVATICFMVLNCLIKTCNTLPQQIVA